MRALAGSGVISRVVTDDSAVLRRSRWCHLAPSFEGPSVADYLESLGEGHDVLVPCSDEWVRRLASLPRELRQQYPMVIAEPGVVETFLDKARFAEHVAMHDVPHPRTVVLDEVGSGDVPYFENAFIKPRDSQAFLRLFGVKAVYPETRREFEELLGQIRDRGVGVIVQEYIPGSASDHCFVDGFADHDGRIRAILGRRRLRMYPRRFGNSSYMISVSPGEIGPAVKTVRDLVERVGYRGIFSAELKWDARDSSFKVLEVNARPWWFVEFTARCGVDVTTMYYRDALGLPIEDVFEYEVGRSMVHPYYDSQACWGLWRSGQLSLPSWVRSWLRSEGPIFRWNDPMPALEQAGLLIRSFLARRLPGSAPIQTHLEAGPPR